MRGIERRFSKFEGAENFLKQGIAEIFERKTILVEEFICFIYFLFFFVL